MGVFFERRFQPLSAGGFFSNQRESISRCPKSPFPSKTQNRQIARTSPLMRKLPCACACRCRSRLEAGLCMGFTRCLLLAWTVGLVKRVHRSDFWRRSQTAQSTSCQPAEKLTPFPKPVRSPRAVDLPGWGPGDFSYLRARSRLGSFSALPCPRNRYLALRSNACRRQLLGDEKSKNSLRHCQNSVESVFQVVATFNLRLQICRSSSCVCSTARTADVRRFG